MQLECPALHLTFRDRRLLASYRVRTESTELVGALAGRASGAVPVSEAGRADRDWLVLASLLSRATGVSARLVSASGRRTSILRPP